jgi:hypothetical protein
MCRATRVGFGLLFLWASGVHVGIVSADPQLYSDVADTAWFPGIREAWREVFMAHPRAWGLAVAGGELVIAGLLLRGGQLRRLGVSAAAGFHVGLMLLGWGFWLWSVPALALLLVPRPAPRKAPISVQSTSDDPVEAEWPYPTIVSRGQSPISQEDWGPARGTPRTRGS